MTATERAKRSDALYYETVSVTRRVLCDMVANREADLEDAQESVKRLMTQRDERLARAETENARLREQVDAAHMSRLLTENENEELRELSARAWRLFTEHGAVNPCDLPVVDAVRDSMRELGVEVDA